METLRVSRSKEALKAKRELEKEIDVKISLDGKRVVVEGDGLSEYEAEIVFDAIDCGFSAKKALKLLNEDMIFRKIHIKNHTAKKSLETVRSRLIGKKGQTRKVLEEISGCNILITDSDVCVIGDAESIEHVTTAVVNLIKGSKQSNMYQYLERMNRVKKSNRL